MTENNKTNQHGKHQPNYYSQNKQKFLLANQKYRAKLKAKKKPKPRSLFLQNREQKFINCLDKHHLVVPIPRSLKTKHPIIQGWNKPNWWWQTKIPQLLAQGYNYFTLLNKDSSYKGVRIGCIDIDEKGWTKIPTKYWCCYISADNGKIKLLFLYEDNCGLKTGKGYFQGKPILDFKISGGIMGIGSFHPNGKPYQVKGAGSFFLMNNHIFKNPYEVIELLKQDWQIEIKTMREHFAWQKIQPIPAEIPFTLTEKSFFIPSREPPGSLNNLSKIANY
jgi:hypothetical protein